MLFVFVDLVVQSALNSPARGLRYTGSMPKREASIVERLYEECDQTHLSASSDFEGKVSYYREYFGPK